MQDLLNGGAAGEYRCLYVNVEAGQAGREDTARAMRAILGELTLRARLVLRDQRLDEIWLDILDKLGPDGALKELLAAAADLPDMLSPGWNYTVGSPVALHAQGASIKLTDLVNRYALNTLRQRSATRRPCYSWHDERRRLRGT